MTHLEFLVWHRWLDDRWNEPDLVCHYLMQVGAEVRVTRQMFGKNAQPVRVNDLKLKFEKKQDEDRPLTDAEAKMVEARWLAKLGLLGGGQRQGRAVERQPRQPGHQHDARNAARGVAPNAGTVPAPRVARGGRAATNRPAAKAPPLRRGADGAPVPDPPAGGRRSKSPTPAQPPSREGNRKR